MASIEIKQLWTDGGRPCCNEECDLMDSKCGCVKGWSDIYQDRDIPNYDCPGPGKYRLVSEEKLLQFHEEIMAAVHTTGTLEDLPKFCRLNEILDRAGLGRKETNHA